MQTGLIAFDAVAKINRISLDLRSIIREHSINDEEIEVEELLRIMKQFDFKAKVKHINAEKIFKENYPFPAIIINRDNTYSVLLKINNEAQRVLILDIKEGKSKDISYDELEELTDNKFIILAHNLINSQIKFGFK